MDTASARSVRRHTLAVTVVLGIHAILVTGLISGTLVRPAPVGPDDLINWRIIDAARPLPPIVPPPPPPEPTALPIEFPPYTPPDIRGPASDSSAISPIGNGETVPGSAVLRMTPARLSAGIILGDRCQAYYPAVSRRLNEEGSVVVLIYVATDGHPTDTRIETSSGLQRLDDATVKCVMNEGRFEPQRVGSDPIGSWQRMKYTWRLIS